jgi:hypothetical protein
VLCNTAQWPVHAVVVLGKVLQGKRDVLHEIIGDRLTVKTWLAYGFACFLHGGEASGNLRDMGYAWDYVTIVKDGLLRPSNANAII